MKQKKIQFEYTVIAQVHDLAEDDQALYRAAMEAMKTAYAPYSQFHVGAAVRLVNGATVTGSNQENIAYPSGLCAERVALFAAGAGHPGVAVKALAIAARHNHQTAEEETTMSEESVTPCGACRQVMLEYERLHHTPMRIITGSPSGPLIVIENAESLLPLAFFDAVLAKK